MRCRFVTPPENQGQIVTYSYAATPKGLVQRVYDASDRTTTYYATKWTRALDRWFDAVGPHNAAPPAARWRKISEDEAEGAC